MWLWYRSRPGARNRPPGWGSGGARLTYPQDVLVVRLGDDGAAPVAVQCLPALPAQEHRLPAAGRRGQRCGRVAAPGVPPRSVAGHVVAREREVTHLPGLPAPREWYRVSLYRVDFLHQVGGLVLRVVAVLRDHGGDAEPVADRLH